MPDEFVHSKTFDEANVSIPLGPINRMGDSTDELRKLLTALIRWSKWRLTCRALAPHLDPIPADDAGRHDLVVRVRDKLSDLRVTEADREMECEPLNRVARTLQDARQVLERMPTAQDPVGGMNELVYHLVALGEAVEEIVDWCEHQATKRLDVAAKAIEEVRTLLRHGLGARGYMRDKDFDEGGDPAGRGLAHTGNKVTIHGASQASTFTQGKRDL